MLAQPVGNRLNSSRVLAYHLPQASLLSPLPVPTQRGGLGFLKLHVARSGHDFLQVHIDLLTWSVWLVRHSRQPLPRRQLNVVASVSRNVRLPDVLLVSDRVVTATRPSSAPATRRRACQRLAGRCAPDRASDGESAKFKMRYCRPFCGAGRAASGGLDNRAATVDLGTARQSDQLPVAIAARQRRPGPALTPPPSLLNAASSLGEALAILDSEGPGGGCGTCPSALAPRALKFEFGPRSADCQCRPTGKLHLQCSCVVKVMASIVCLVIAGAVLVERARLNYVSRPKHITVIFRYCRVRPVIQRRFIQRFRVTVGVYYSF